MAAIGVAPRDVTALRVLLRSLGLDVMTDEDRRPRPGPGPGLTLSFARFPARTIPHALPRPVRARLAKRPQPVHRGEIGHAMDSSRLTAGVADRKPLGDHDLHDVLDGRP